MSFDYLEAEMIETTTRELAARTNDGIEIVLLWYVGTDRLELRVDDTRTGETFVLDVDHTHALDAFEHPYAYAAFRGVEYADPAREPIPA
jgi:hypothetical protein